MFDEIVWWKASKFAISLRKTHVVPRQGHSREKQSNTTKKSKISMENLS